VTTYFHEDATFVQTIDLASEQTGCPAALVEKDYWLTSILRAIAHSEHGEHSIFKGGTSLWKAFALIQMFSEDSVPRKHGGYACNKTS
jgi:predicted nucleotidyltransferase component of viral defense system